MIGIVVVSHNNIGQEMVATTKKIIPDCANITSISIESDLPPEANRNKISEAIKSVDLGNGVILLTDMFGGTPSNLCLSFLEKGRIEIISGFNLPMLIKLASKYDDTNFDELTTYIKKYGQKNIVIASEVLDGKVDYQQHAK